MDEFDLGYYDIGYDDDDTIDALLSGYAEIGDALVGAKRRPMGRGIPKPAGAALSRAVAARRVQQGALLRDVAPTKSRQYALPMDSVNNINAAVAANVNAQPQVLFRPERLVIDQNANSWLVNDLRVGKNSQFVAAGSMPGAAFGANAFGVRLKCDTAQISQLITLNVTNNSGGALRFLGVLFGDAVE